jgi:Na+/proline symporter
LAGGHAEAGVTLLDASIIGAFLLYVVIVGLRDRRQASAGPEQYFLAGRSLTGWQAGISMAATQFAADTPLLVAGLVAVRGIFALVFTYAQVLVRSLIWLPIALGLLVLFPPQLALDAGAYVAEREFTFVRGIAEVLPVGVIGLMLTGMIAALASTVDTHLNWGASYWANDIYKRFICGWRGVEPSGRSLVWVARLSNVLILAIALAVMARLDSIKLAWELSLLLGAGVGVVLVLRWLWWRITAWRSRSFRCG